MRLTFALLIAVVLSGCLAHQDHRYSRSIGIVAKTLVAAGTVACAAVAVAANTQIDDNNSEGQNMAWAFTGLGAGLAADILALVALLASKEPGKNWWDRSGWAWTTGIAAGVGVVGGVAAIVRGAGGKECCVICTGGCACGDTCIDCSKTCQVGPGCACN